jgi:hypothetical protein
MVRVGVGVSLCVAHPLVSISHCRFHWSWNCLFNTVLAADFRRLKKSGVTAVLSVSLCTGLLRVWVQPVAFFASSSASSFNSQVSRDPVKFQVVTFGIGCFRLWVILLTTCWPDCRFGGSSIVLRAAWFATLVRSDPVVISYVFA